MTEHRDLLFYVDRLRAPYRDPVVQVNENRIQCVNHVERDGLLKQLRDAIYSGIGHHGASSAGAFRLPFDAGALTLYSHLEDEIGAAFYNLTGEPVYLELERTLSAWYLAHTEQVRKGRLTLLDDDRALVWVRGWVGRVEDLFNPPSTLSLRDDDGRPSACPACHTRFAFDVDSGDRVFALRVEIRDPAHEVFGSVRGLCRACGAEWRGEVEARGLALRLGSVVDEGEVAA
jgi:hypothetical protein